MVNYKELAGAWEEPGVIGTRIEIEGKKLTVLWRNSPVLETAFTAKEKDGATVLDLKKTGMRYKGAVSDYASVMSIAYEDGKLTFKENFPISGESVSVLKKTENSRYGNYTIVDDEILPLLRGSWRSDDGYYRLDFVKNTVRCDAEAVKIHVLKSRYPYESGYRIVDEDPSNYGLFHFDGVTYCDGVITARIPVCDAPSINIVFKKI